MITGTPQKLIRTIREWNNSFFPEVHKENIADFFFAPVIVFIFIFEQETTLRQFLTKIIIEKKKLFNRVLMNVKKLISNSISDVKDLIIDSDSGIEFNELFTKWDKL